MMSVARFFGRVMVLSVVLFAVIISSAITVNRQMRRPILAYVVSEYNNSRVAIVDVERGISLGVSYFSIDAYCLLDSGQKFAYTRHLNPETGEWDIEVFDLNTESRYSVIPTQPSPSPRSPLACSADGQWLAFSTNDEIRVIDYAGERQHTVTSIDWIEYPSLMGNMSADGLFSLFIENDDVWVRNVASDLVTQLTFMESPASLPRWSHDGMQIAFALDVMNPYEGCQLWVMNNDGSEAHGLSTPPLTHCRDLAWSPDGSQIALSGLNDCWVSSDDCPPFVSDNVYVVNTDGSGFRQIVEGIPASEYFSSAYYRLTWLP